MAGKNKHKALSKSKLIAYRQCPKRFWLETHSPELHQDSAATQASFKIGHQVGDIAQRIYDPDAVGVLIEPFKEGFKRAFQRSHALLSGNQPIFEAAFTAAGALALADVMLPEDRAGTRCWRMIEVKSSTSVKDYYRDDVAIQSYIAKLAGINLTSIAIAHIDSSWVYPGVGDYQGLLIEEDLTDEAFSRGSEVQQWIDNAKCIRAQTNSPEISTGPQCLKPYECGFLNHCKAEEDEDKAENPVEWLPRIQKKSLKSFIEMNHVKGMHEVPDELLNEQQKRVKSHTLAGTAYFDIEHTKEVLAGYPLPAYFIDFETINLAIPIWAGIRPFQQVAFQFSIHKLFSDGSLEHTEFLDLSGNDPSEAFARALVSQCGLQGPVFVYNAGFETARIRELAQRIEPLSDALLAINERIVDLYRIATKYYYHPSQQGSWSIKKVLPTVAPELRYDQLDGIQDGGMAIGAYIEAIDKGTPTKRKQSIEAQLLAYCKMDTFAMVRLWGFFAGKERFIITQD